MRIEKYVISIWEKSVSYFGFYWWNNCVTVFTEKSLFFKPFLIKSKSKIRIWQLSPNLQSLGVVIISTGEKSNRLTRQKLKTRMLNPTRRHFRGLILIQYYFNYKKWTLNKLTGNGNKTCKPSSTPTSDCQLYHN